MPRLPGFLTPGLTGEPLGRSVGRRLAVDAGSPGFVA
jgi:hypothetical protein